MMTPARGSSGPGAHNPIARIFRDSGFAPRSSCSIVALTAASPCSAEPVTGIGVRVCCRISPVAQSTIPAATFVPPMSTPITRVSKWPEFRERGPIRARNFFLVCLAIGIGNVQSVRRKRRLRAFPMGRQHNAAFRDVRQANNHRAFRRRIASPRRRNGLARNGAACCDLVLFAQSFFCLLPLSIRWQICLRSRILLGRSCGVQ